VTSPGRNDEVLYDEPARTYATAWGLGGILLAGLVIDAALGSAAVHALGWLIAVVIVVGADVLVTRAARATRSITVTPSELRVGDEAIALGSIVGIAHDTDARVLGRRPGEPLPRGASGLALRLEDGQSVVVPTRNPQALRATLSAGDAVPEIRQADDHELADLVELERRSDTLLTVAGIGPLPDPAIGHETIRDAHAVLVAGRPAVGFARVDEVDGQAHLEQLSVLPGHMRRGIGTALVEAVCAWATEHGYREVTLCTFADVAWNGPFYAKRGFEPVQTLTPGLAELRGWERDLGLDALGPRIAMRRLL
jgi:GNAT superfamily N-acetyltransferase